MRIISSFKDYYDYLQGVIGQDPLAYYERIPGNKSIGFHEKWFKHSYSSYAPVVDGDPSKEIVLSIVTSDGHAPSYSCNLHICDWKYKFVVDNRGKFYLPPFLKLNKNNPNTLYDILESYGWPDHVLSKYKVRWTGGYDYAGYTDTDLNTKENCPIIFEAGKFLVCNPRLEDIGLNKIIPAEQMYHMLTNWFLSKRDSPSPKPISDKNKILSHGMDPKRSFRPNIKS